MIIVLNSIARSRGFPGLCGRCRAAAAFAMLLAVTLPAAAQRPAFGGSSSMNWTHGPHGGGHGRGGPGRARAAFYDIVTVSGATDAVAAKAAEGRFGATLAGTSGRLVVAADDPVATVGAAPSYLAVIVFDDVWSAQAWQRSEPVKAILADLGKSATVSVVTAGGLADPGVHPTIPLEALGAGKAVRLPVIPTIADICKGC
jgi:hypothetical protein